MPSLLEALEQKYGSDSSTESEGSEEEQLCVSIFLPRRPPRATVPSLLVLNDCDIQTAGEQETLMKKCSAVEELDLAKNKLNYWSEVYNILQQMPNLKFVNLSFNQLSMPLSAFEVDTSFKWNNLKSLVLNSTKIDWESVQKILDSSPTLEELHLSLNDYKHVDLSGKTCECITFCKCPRKHKHLSVQKVHFNGNFVNKWEEVLKIGYAFPNLEYLVLANCPIDTLYVDTETKIDDNENNGVDMSIDSDYESNDEQNVNNLSHESFNNLQFLNLNWTQLSSWNEIERLAKFPKLRCLRVQGCPFVDNNEYTEHERRQFIIARLPNIAMLNGGGIITANEREDAERAFIRYYMEKPENERPPRYEELVSIHGKLDPLVNIDLRPEKKVNVKFTCGEKSETRLVDVYRTVYDLKMKLESFAGFAAHRMRLFYVDQDMDAPEEMKYPNKKLYSYNIRSGDEIIIDQKIRLSESK